MKRLLFGALAGASAGYALYRTLQAARAVGAPQPVVPKDAARYGEIRRALALAGTLRGMASASAVAYGGPMDAIAHRTQGLPVWLRLPVLSLAGSIAGAATDLPLEFIEGYELERRYGLSDQSARAWLGEYAKGAALSSAFTAMLTIPFSALLRKAPQRWPLYATAGLVPLFILTNLIVPVYIAPLFNNFEPLEGPLEGRLRALAARFGVGDAQILRVDMSRQTKKANAYVTGLFSTHRIVVGDTLLEHFPDEEVEFVVAHELGHYVSRDSWRLTAFGTLIAGTMMALSNGTLSKRERKHFDNPATVYRLYMLMLLYSQSLRPALFAFTRSREWAADEFAVAATGEPVWGVRAFERLRDQNLAEDDVPRWYEIFFSTHPSLGDRIKELKAATR